MPLDLQDVGNKSNAAGSRGGAGTNNSNPSAGGGHKPNQSMPLHVNTDQMQRARVLCSYDAKDHTELNLSANEVSQGQREESRSILFMYISLCRSSSSPNAHPSTRITCTANRV